MKIRQEWVRVLLACVIAPGLPSLTAFLVVSSLAIKLPDNFGSHVFITETVIFYFAALPGFLLVYASGKRLVTYALVGMFATWPLWMLMICLPSDASVDPLNPQFFLAWTTAGLGLMSGLLFHRLARKPNLPQPQKG